MAAPRGLPSAVDFAEPCFPGVHAMNAAFPSLDSATIYRMVTYPIHRRTWSVVVSGPSEITKILATAWTRPKNSPSLQRGLLNGLLATPTAEEQASSYGLRRTRSQMPQNSVECDYKVDYSVRGESVVLGPSLALCLPR